MTPDEVVKVLQDRLVSKNKEFALGVDILSGTEKVGKWASLKYEIGALSSAILLIQDYQKLLDREKEWQDMCNKHVGCSMLADEFAGEPHEPEEFGGYVDNLEQQAEDYQKLRERVSVEKIVANVPFYQNIMPVERQEIVKQIVTYLQQPTEH